VRLSLLKKLLPGAAANSPMPGSQAIVGAASGGRRLAVLFCTWGYPPGATGGAERQAHRLALELKKLGHHVEVACPAFPGTRSGPVDGVFVHRLPVIARPKVTGPSYCISLLIFLLGRARHFDILHVHLAYLQADVVALAATVLNRRLWVKLAASGQFGEIVRMRSIARVTHYFGLRNADRIQAISRDLEGEALAVGVRPERIERIPNGIDTERFRPVRDNNEKLELRRALRLPKSDMVVLFVGRLARHKGLQDLVQAWDGARMDGATLVLIGSRNTMDPVGTVAGPGILTLGWTGQPEMYYRAADVFVLPSHVEGMSNALLEAMASGLPVVSTTAGAATEMITPGKTGLLLDVGDIAGLTAALRQLLADPIARQNLGRAARADIINRYSIDAVAAKITDGYRRMLDE
jgi:glycosyltransferase involved in cell wall biosynthesis